MEMAMHSRLPASLSRVIPHSPRHLCASWLLYVALRVLIQLLPWILTHWLGAR